VRPSAYIAVVLFAAWGLYMAVRLPHWHDPKYVRRPERRMWAFWQFLDDDEWTERAESSDAATFGVWASLFS